MSKYMNTDSNPNLWDKSEKELVLLVNDDEEIALMTHDAPSLTLKNVVFYENNKQFMIFSVQNPDGHLCKEPVDQRLVDLIKRSEKVLYVNMNSKTNDILQEEWVALEIQ